jgi:hypothetical protein
MTSDNARRDGTVFRCVAYGSREVYCVSIIAQTFKSSDKGGIKGSWYMHLFYSAWVGLVQPDTPLFVTAGPLTFARGAVSEVIRLDIFRDSCFESMRLWTRQSQGSKPLRSAFRWTSGRRRQCLKVCRARMSKAFMYA